MKINDIGLLIFQCEGSKKADNRIVEVVNSDPKIILLFLKFLKSRGVPKKKLRGRVSIHEGQNLNKITDFWSHLTKIPKDQFQKPIIKKSGKHFKKGRRGILENGVFVLRTNSKKLHHSLIREADELLQTLINS